ncbi:MAG: hypothetical protein KZQ77_19580, partial [Candidatus Thiodiazotropha sp. (ex Notomyrtea botanica)]|nr:hypothetical protein [Candidatus Thiodiazotropha sp. (ex Notomyrtea botanica)]
CRMMAPEKIVAEIGQVYRIKCTNCLDALLFTLEAFYEPHWYECQKWDDPGYVAGLLVKHGVIADHQSTFEFLKS